MARAALLELCGGILHRGSRHDARSRVGLELEQLETRLLLTAPQILLTSSVLTNLVQEAQANTPQWQAFKAYLDAGLPVVKGGYQGSELADISNYALGYQILKNIDPLTAANYADKAIGLMKSALNDYQVDASISRQFLIRGDGTTKTFTIPNADFIPSSLHIYLSNVKTVPIVRGTANGQDQVGDYLKFLKVSNTSDGTADYQQGVDWQHNPNLDDSLIDWSLPGKEPATGATYYVTYTGGYGAISTSFTLSGNKFTLATAPTTAQAVYVEYIYGTHSADGSTLAYQQTSAGDGGFNSIFKDRTYTSRFLGKHLAMGLDWLDGYVGLSASFATSVQNMLVRWFNYVHDYGYLTTSPESNYGAGGYDSMVMTALALLNRNAAGPTLMSEVLAYRQNNLLPDLQGPTSLLGGFWAEGWNYGPLAAQNDLLAGLALEAAGQIPGATAERAWASQVTDSLISEQPTLSTIYDGGDWYTYPSPFPGNALIDILSSSADDSVARSFDNYILQQNPSKNTNDYIDMLFRNPSAPASFWGSFPLQYKADGTGLVTARADWNYNSTWMSFQLGNLLEAAHQTYAPGQLQIQRGPDDLLINANAIGGNQNPSTESSFANLIAINDNGAGAQNYPWNMGTWYGTPGVFITNYEAGTGYVYVGGDYHAAYSLNTNPGGGGPATQLTRQVVYLRPDLIVVFDRAGTTVSTYPKQLQWHFLNPAKVNGNSWEEDVGTSKLFGDTFSTVPLTTTTYSVNDAGATLYRVATNNTNASLGVRYVTALETAPSTTGSMASSQQIVSTDGRMQGVEIGANLVLFGTDGPLSPFSGSITYTISSANPISHLLTDLQPSQQYVVQANGVVLGTFTSSTQGTLSFTTSGGSTTITVAAVATTPGTASKLVVSGFPSPTTAGVSHSFTITAQDSSGNTASGYVGTITFSSTDQKAGLPASYTFTATDAGVHTFSATLNTAGSQSITATDTATSTIVGSQAGITVNPAAASTLVVGGYPSSTTAGVSHNFTVTARDAFGNTATGYIGTVSFSSTDVKPILPANYTFTSTDAGVHTFSGTLKTAGTQSLSAKDTVSSSISGTQSGITVNPAATNHLTVSRFPSKTTAGVAQSFRVTAQDMFANTTPGYTGTVTFSSTDSQSVLPANYTFTATDAGVHNFSATLKTAGSQSLTAKDTVNAGVASSTQSGVTVNPAATSQFQVAGFPLSVLPGSSNSFTVTAKDAYGNTTPAYAGTVKFSSSDLQAILPANYTFTSIDAGIHTFAAMLTTVGVQSISVTDTVNAAITGMETGISVAQLTASISGSSIGVPGQSLSFTLGGSESASTIYSYSVQWGDGSSVQTFTGPSGMQVSHTFVAPGAFSVAVTATDPSGSASLPASTLATISAVVMETDPYNPSLTALYVGGTLGDDTIAITPVTGSGVKVAMNMVSYGTFYPTGHVLVFGQSGNDIIKTAAQSINGVLTYVNVPVLFFAGDGTDILNVSGSSANNVLVGGAGADRLLGGQGRDILIGGSGASRLEAGSGGDILIGGTTSNDNNAAALAAILAEWSRTDIDYTTRLAHLTGTASGGLNNGYFLNTSTVKADASVNYLYGGAGLDWYFAGVLDLLYNQTTGEVITTI